MATGESIRDFLSIFPKRPYGSGKLPAILVTIIAAIHNPWFVADITINTH